MVYVTLAGSPIPVCLRGIRYLRTGAGAFRVAHRESSSSLEHPEGCVHDPGQTTSQGIVLSSLERVAGASCATGSGAGKSSAERLAASCSALRKGIAEQGGQCERILKSKVLAHRRVALVVRAKRQFQSLLLLRRSVQQRSTPSHAKDHPQLFC